jgi:hypothetical protein
VVKVASGDETLGVLYVSTYFEHVFGTWHVVWKMGKCMDEVLETCNGKREEAS